MKSMGKVDHFLFNFKIWQLQLASRGTSETDYLAFKRYTYVPTP